VRYGIDGGTDQAFDERKDGLRDGKEQSYRKRFQEADWKLFRCMLVDMICHSGERRSCTIVVQHLR